MASPCLRMMGSATAEAGQDGCGKASAARREHAFAQSNPEESESEKGMALSQGNKRDISHNNTRYSLPDSGGVSTRRSIRGAERGAPI